MNLVNLFVTTLAVINVCLGVFAVIKNRKSLLNFFLGLFVVGVGGWGIAISIMVSTREAIWPRIGFFFVSMSFAFFTLFLFKFFRKNINFSKIPLVIFIVLGIFFAGASLTRQIVYGVAAGSVENNGGGLDLERGGLYLYLLAYYMGNFIYVVYLMVRGYKRSAGLMRNRIRYFFLGILTFVFFAMVTNLILPSLGIANYNNLGPVFSVFMTIPMIYVILKYRFMGLHVLASKIFFYIVIAVFFYSSFYLTHFFRSIYATSSFSADVTILGVFAAILLAVFFVPFLNYIQKTSDTIFFRGANPRTVIKDIIIKINAVLSINHLFEILSAEFKKILEVDNIRFVVFGNHNKETVIDKCSNKCPIIPRESLFFHAKEIIVRDEITEKEPELARDMDKVKAKIIAPLISRKKTVGFIMLGEKIGKGGYTLEDIEFLQIISSQAAIAVENAILFKEVESFNRDLKKQVDKQTKDIREKAEKLQKLLAMRSEFLDIASHQLRTPISVIKGMLSMVVEGDVPGKKQTEFLEAAFQKSLKLEEIIDEILKASEMDSDKFELNLVPTHLGPIINEIIHDKLDKAKEKGIELQFEMPKKPLPLIMTDERYLQHAIRNLVNNSLQYTLHGSIKVVIGRSGKNAFIRVVDTGIGIPKKDQKKLFKKFSRAKNAVDTYTDGSGLGLFIVKKIIEGHEGGKIVIEKSVLNQGTTMLVTLPIAKEGSKPKENNEESE